MSVSSDAKSDNPLTIVILGLSITSSWGNGHATTYRSLVRALDRRGHHVIFLERDMPWYASNRDLPRPPYGEVHLYRDLPQLERRFTDMVRQADLVIVGSYVPEGVAVGMWATQTAYGLTAFYDIDTPVTLAKLRRRDHEYLSPDLLPRYDLYLSFTGGPTLALLEERYGARAARPLYCSVDPDNYYPDDQPVHWDLGYMGTYSDDRQPGLEWLLLEPARRRSRGRFVVAGPNYPASIQWPENVDRIDHLPPDQHRLFYNRQRFTLNITRADMIAAGYSPSVRLFEAAACGTPIIRDHWEGLDTFFEIGTEILVARSALDCLRFLDEISEEERRRIGERARHKILNHHTSHHRALALEQFVSQQPVPRSIPSIMNVA